MRVATGLFVLALAGCHRAASTYSETSPTRTCAGRLVLEFTNRLVEPVQVGWIPAGDSSTVSVEVGPTWLGTIGRGTARYAVMGPGYVIFRTANPSGLTGEHHDVTHRLLCVQG